MNFGQALTHLKLGERMCRASWHSYGLVSSIYLVPGSIFTVNRPPLDSFYRAGTVVSYKPHIDATYLDGTCGVWDTPQADLLAEDWEILPSVKHD